MIDRGDGLPGQKESRSRNERHHECNERHHEYRVGLNVPAKGSVRALSMISSDRARSLIWNRPSRSWDAVERIPGIGMGVVDDLNSGEAQLGFAGDERR